MRRAHYKTNEILEFIVRLRPVCILLIDSSGVRWYTVNFGENIWKRWNLKRFVSVKLKSSFATSLCGSIRVELVPFDHQRIKTTVEQHTKLANNRGRGVTIHRHLHGLQSASSGNWSCQNNFEILLRLLCFARQLALAYNRVEYLQRDSFTGPAVTYRNHVWMVCLASTSTLHRGFELQRCLMRQCMGCV